MPSFDIVSKIEIHELNNAIDQANREVKTRFDFKDSDASFIFAEDKITLSATNKFQIEQMQQILTSKLTKRNIDISCLEYGNITENLHEAKQLVTVKQGIDQDTGKKINKLIKDLNLKVQSSIMGEHIRVTGKKRDDLQDVISALRQINDKIGIPVQFENFRD